MLFRKQNWVHQALTVQNFYLPPHPETSCSSQNNSCDVHNSNFSSLLLALSNPGHFCFVQILRSNGPVNGAVDGLETENKFIHIYCYPQCRLFIARVHNIYSIKERVSSSRYTLYKHPASSSYCALLIIFSLSGWFLWW